MTASIYDMHRAAFSSVSAFIITKDGKRVATVAFKYPRDGAGRLWCYVHVLGLEMTRGYAGGGGYDKHSAACESAVERIKMHDDETYPELAVCRDIKAALASNGGYSWDRRIRDAGFDVLQAV